MPRRSGMAALVATVMAVLLLPHPVAADEQDELNRTCRKLGEVEAVLRDAHADAGAVAATLAAADQAVAAARARLATSQAELAVARRRRADAMAALEAATEEVARQEAGLASQVRSAYMTGQVSALAMVVQASDLRDLLERAVTLSYVVSADQAVGVPGLCRRPLRHGRAGQGLLAGQRLVLTPARGRPRISWGGRPG